MNPQQIENPNPQVNQNQYSASAIDIEAQKRAKKKKIIIWTIGCSVAVLFVTIFSCGIIVILVKNSLENLNSNLSHIDDGGQWTLKEDFLQDSCVKNLKIDGSYEMKEYNVSSESMLSGLDLPSYSKTLRADFVGNNPGTSQYIFCSDLGKNKLYSYFKDHLNKKGWKTGVEDNYKGKSIYASKGSTQIMVFIPDKDNKGFVIE
jgi:hypothetical protein